MKEEKSSDNPWEGREGRGRIFIHLVGKILHPGAQRVGQARKTQKYVSAGTARKVDSFLDHLPDTKFWKSQFC